MLHRVRPIELVGTVLCLLKEPQAGWTKGTINDSEPVFSVAVEGRHALAFVADPVIAMQLAGILTVTSTQGLEVSSETSDAEVACSPFLRGRERMLSVRVSGVRSVIAERIGQGEVAVSMSPKTAQAVAQSIFGVMANLWMWKPKASKSSPEPTTPSS